MYIYNKPDQSSMSIYNNPPTTYKPNQKFGCQYFDSSLYLYYNKKHSNCVAVAIILCNNTIYLDLDNNYV
jgi:hypothetical protein